MEKNHWHNDQLTVALNLYWKIPYNKISGSSNSLIKETAPLINRTPAALAYKLMNFTALDNNRQNKGQKGKSSASNADKEIWRKYEGKWGKLALDSFYILSIKLNKSIKQILSLENANHFAKGEDKERLIKVRINQRDFRQRILANYNERCCVTGLPSKALLVASHIIPWSVDKASRLNPNNGLCLNYLHDKAFDQGLFTITTDFKVKLSDSIYSLCKENSIKKYFIKHDNQTITLPDRFRPSQDFLEYHRKNIFNRTLNPLPAYENL